jgi:hypothetical protein
MGVLERPKPQDLLKFEGPHQSLSTYELCFPGHRGENQYVNCELSRSHQPTDTEEENTPCWGSQSIPPSLSRRDSLREKMQEKLTI